MKQAAEKHIHIHIRILIRHLGGVIHFVVRSFVCLQFCMCISPCVCVCVCVASIILRFSSLISNNYEWENLLFFGLYLLLYASLRLFRFCSERVSAYEISASMRLCVFMWLANIISSFGVSWCHIFDNNKQASKYQQQQSQQKLRGYKPNAILGIAKPIRVLFSGMRWQQNDN